MIRQYTLVILTFVLGLLHTSATAQQLASTASLILQPIDIETDLLSATEVPITQSKPWQQTASIVAGHISHDKLTGMKKRTEALILLLHDLFSVDTLDASWHGEYFSPRSFGAQCSFYAGKKAGLLLLVNDLSPLLGHYTVNGTDYLTIRASITHQNGCLHFNLPRPEADDQPADSNIAANTSFWLITPDSIRLPYTPITRREYLLEIRKQLISDTNYIATEWRNKFTIRPLTEQEAEKQR